MLKKILYATVLFSLAFVGVQAQTAQSNSDTVMILPFENTSAKAEFNWVGESFANSLTDLPSLATSLKLAREGNATFLIAGRYNIILFGHIVGHIQFLNIINESI